MLGDLKFLDSLKEYDKDNIPAPLINRIRKNYISNPDFDPAIIKNSSSACEGLCKWVRAIEVYDGVAKVVAPKRESLDKAEQELAAQMAKLNEKRAELKAVTDKLASLEENLDRKQAEKQVWAMCWVFILSCLLLFLQMPKHILHVVKRIISQWYILLSNVTQHHGYRMFYVRSVSFWYKQETVKWMCCSNWYFGLKQ